MKGRALVIVDEVYAEFAAAIAAITPGTLSMTQYFATHPNVVVLRSLSKAYSLAGVRCGVVLAHPGVIAYLHKAMLPYTLARTGREAIVHITSPQAQRHAQESIKRIHAERERLFTHLEQHPAVRKVWPSVTNFLYVQLYDRNTVVRACATQSVHVHLIPDDETAIRVSIGLPEANDRFLAVLSHTTHQPRKRAL